MVSHALSTTSWAGVGSLAISYVDGVCGVRADFTLNDVTVDPDDFKIRRKDSESCDGTDKRFMRLIFDDPVDGGEPLPSIDVHAFMNADKVELVTVADGPVGRSTVFFPHGSSCGRLVFGGPPGTDPLQVTRISESPDVWEIEAPAGTLGVCSNADRLFNMEFKITVRRKEDLI